MSLAKPSSWLLVNGAVILAGSTGSLCFSFTPSGIQLFNEEQLIMTDANGRLGMDMAHETSSPTLLPSLSRHPSLRAALAAVDIDMKGADVVRIGTRASHLALIQANQVKDGLEAGAVGKALSFRIAPMSTAGDRNKTEPLYLMGAKALWTKDLEVALLENVVDCIVHSMKDVPTSLPEGCEIAAIMEREDPRDALVVKQGKPWKGLEDMPQGGCVGSSSVRRVAQLRRQFSHLTYKDVRGNM